MEEIIETSKREHIRDMYLSGRDEELREEVHKIIKLIDGTIKDLRKYMDRKDTTLRDLAASVTAALSDMSGAMGNLAPPKDYSPDYLARGPGGFVNGLVEAIDVTVGRKVREITIEVESYLRESKYRRFEDMEIDEIPIELNLEAFDDDDVKTLEDEIERFGEFNLPDLDFLGRILDGAEYRADKFRSTKREMCNIVEAASNFLRDLGDFALKIHYTSLGERILEFVGELLDTYKVYMFKGIILASKKFAKEFNIRKIGERVHLKEYEYSLTKLLEEKGIDIDFLSVTESKLEGIKRSLEPAGLSNTLQEVDNYLQRVEHLRELYNICKSIDKVVEENRDVLLGDPESVGIALFGHENKLKVVPTIVDVGKLLDYFGSIVLEVVNSYNEIQKEKIERIHDAVRRELKEKMLSTIPIVGLDRVRRILNTLPDESNFKRERTLRMILLEEGVDTKEELIELWEGEILEYIITKKVNKIKKILEKSESVEIYGTLRKYSYVVSYLLYGKDILNDVDEEGRVLYYLFGGEEEHQISVSADEIVNVLSRIVRHNLSYEQVKMIGYACCGNMKSPKGLNLSGLNGRDVEKMIVIDSIGSREIIGEHDYSGASIESYFYLERLDFWMKSANLTLNKLGDKARTEVESTLQCILNGIEERTVNRTDIWKKSPTEISMEDRLIFVHDLSSLKIVYNLFDIPQGSFIVEKRLKYVLDYWKGDDKLE